MNSESRHPELLPLTGLRFLAALLICFAHTVPKVIPSRYNEFFSSIGTEGMTLFFVLSGFVIHYNYSALIKKNVLLGTYNFIISRFARLYPLFFVCLTYDLFSQYKHSILTPYVKSIIIYYLTLTHAWFYIPFGKNALIYQLGLMPQVTWSISTEWFFYLCYPIILFVLLRNSTLNKAIVRTCLLSFIFMSTVLIIAYNKNLINEYAISIYGPIADNNTNIQDSFFRWLIYFSPYSRIFEFILGCCIASIHFKVASFKPTKKEELIGYIAIIGAIIGLVIMHYFVFNPPFHLNFLICLHQNFGFAPLIAIIIFCCARYNNIIVNLFSKKWIIIGGEMSYSIYIFHLPIASLYSDNASYASTFKIACADSYKYLIMLGTIFGISYLSYKIIEIPCRRWLRKKMMIKEKIPLLQFN